MSDAVIEIAGLRKKFRSLRGGPRVALDGLDMEVQSGGVHGFLGPNGSGKTTTIRTLLGVVRADAGTIKLFGQPVPQQLPDVIGRIGAIVESPQFFPAFSGRRNLMLLAATAGIDERRVDEVLDKVGLAQRAKDRYKTYSLGMKQRLAVAGALLREPTLLILDEPMNGLDPAGMREIRNLMQEVAANGTTVLLSSHILAEVQQVCDSVTILSHGKQIASGAVQDVLASGGATEVVVRVDDLGTAQRILASAELTVRQENGRLVVGGVADPAAITKLLAEEGHYVSELTPTTADLESVFLQLTGTGDQLSVPVGVSAGEVA